MSDSAIINAPIPTAQSLCPLCHEIFLDPRILPCLHTLCLSCLNRLRPFTSTRNGSETQKSLLCPVCDSEVVLPPEGVTGLVPDMVAEEEVLREMLRSGAHEPPCDLCGEGRAQNRCQDCKVNVCEFCCQAHRRQTRTARHHLLPMQDLPPGLSLTPVPLCKVHLLEELRLFCEPCSVPACRDCALTRHQGHAVRPVAEVAGRHREHVQKAVMEVEAQLTELEAAMKGVHSVKEALNRRAELLREEVEAFTDKYISAVHEHRSRLLRDIDEEIQRRQQTLSLQGARIQQQISDLSTATSFTKGLLERAPDVHLARTQSLVLNRLQGLRHGDLKMAEMEEATGIQFSPQEEAGLCQGYRMYGGVTGRGVDPERSEVRGVRSARVGEPSGFTLTCNDASGESMGHGGQQPRVTILYKGSERSLQSSIQDRHDGSYRVLYTPPAPGELALSALLKGRHIRGSPFTVTVTDASHQHRGIYHCCSFCSSGGQKDARCACGGTMPGGYQGCGHGHKGHPGRPHWSCCGGTTEKSECQSMKKVVPRNLLRTVAL